ncbi:fructosamine kinase family protein [Salininema proteolyticum]|uniref:Fructosamine kinase family protein n=1 Tax=Salininema proteolyticum TaxID=1607685 RepID=A0ABV8TX43_9ACTN
MEPVPYRLLPELLHHQRVRSTPIKSEASASAQRLTFEDGSSVFAKFASGSRPGFMRAESEGLAWLGEACDAVVEVLYADDGLLVEPWIDTAEPTAGKARDLGHALARLHRSGAGSFGAPWKGYIGELEMDNTPSEGPWTAWYAERRLLPYLSESRSNGALDASDAALVEKLVDRLDRFAGPEEPPARLHGDLWFGNVHWGADRAWLIDPSAHGGHRETDLANLRLWGGTPFTNEIVTAYEELFPLADGWRERIGIHQLYPLLAHTALFGSSYRRPLMDAVERYVSV